jgi:hypothetical protein
MAKKTKRYFAIAFTTKDGRDLKAHNLQYNLPRGSVLGAWHSKSAQKKRIEFGKCGFKSAFGDTDSLYNYYDRENLLGHGERAFIVEISGRIDVDFDEEFIASEKIRFIKEIKPLTLRTLKDAAIANNVVTSKELELLVEGVDVAHI